MLAASLTLTLTLTLNTGASLLTDEGIVSFFDCAAAGGRLGLLNIKGSSITCQGLLSILRCCPALTGLNISDCTLINTDGLRALANTITLRDLNLAGLSLGLDLFEGLTLTLTLTLNLSDKSLVMD